MSKQFITSFFTLILLFSIFIPSYYNLIEEISKIEVVDMGEEEKSGKESAEEFELKNYYTFDDSSLYIGLEKKKRIGFYSKNYSSYFKKLIAPPPKVIA